MGGGGRGGGRGGGIPRANVEPSYAMHTMDMCYSACVIDIPGAIMLMYLYVYEGSRDVYT